MIAKIRLTVDINEQLKAGTTHDAVIAEVGNNAQIVDGQGVFWYVCNGNFTIEKRYDLSLLDDRKPEEKEEPRLHDIVGGKPKSISIEFFEAH